MRVAETGIAFRVYEGPTDFVGAGSVTLPTISNMMQTISGAGIAGEYESAIIGQTQAMNLQIAFPLLNSVPLILMEQRAHNIELRPVNQERVNRGMPELARMKHLFVCQPSELAGGTVAPAAKNDSTVSFSVTRWQAFENGREILLIDKLNFIYRVNGTDYMRELRRGLGMS